MADRRECHAKRAEEVLQLASQHIGTDPRRSCRLFLRAARLLSKSGDPAAVINALLSAAEAARCAGSLNRALSILRRARKLASRSGNSLLFARALYQTAVVELARGSHRRARRFARAAFKFDPTLPREPFFDPALQSFPHSSDPLSA